MGAQKKGKKKGRSRDDKTAQQQKKKRGTAGSSEKSTRKELTSKNWGERVRRRCIPRSTGKAKRKKDLEALPGLHRLKMDRGEEYD